MMEKKIPSRIRRIRNMKIKKSTISMFVAVFAFVFSMFYVFAGENSKISIDKIESAAKGDVDLEVNVKLDSEKEYNSGLVEVEFDPDVLEYTGAVTASVGNPSAPKKQQINITCVAPSSDEEIEEANQTGKLSVACVIPTTGKTVNEDIDLATFFFDVKDDAPGGKSQIKVTNASFAKEIDNVKEVLTMDTEDGYVIVEAPVDINSVVLEKDNFELQKGSTENLVVNYSPADTTDNKTFTYEVTSGDAVTVDEDGKITAVKNGNAVVKVTAFGKELIANVTVVNHITKVTITATKTEIAKEEELQLSADITPADTSDDKTLTWDSSNKDAAIVDQNGKVTGVSGGKTTITATSKNNVVGSIEIEVVVPMTGFRTNDDPLVLSKGDTHDVTYEILPGDTTESKEITWNSTNNDVATVNNGLITAVGGGSAVITGTLPNQRQITINVTVNVPLESISLDKENIDLFPTQTQTLNLTINPSDTTDTSEVTWTSDTKGVATVENGVVTAVAAGDAIITVTKGTKSDTVNVHVKKPIESFVISKTETTLNRNQSEQLTVNIIPEDAEEDKNVTWSSSDPTSVSVDQTGKITGLKGTQSPVTITAKLPNGSEQTCMVTVVVLINDISLNKTETTINKGKTDTLTVSFDPEDTSESKDVTWETSDPNVATVNNGVVTAVGAGNATITATVGTHSKVCAVTVEVPIESVTINKEDFELNRGSNETLTATINPSDATGDKTITWESSNNNVATVDSNGKVTAVGAGEATITAKAGNKSDTVKVTVVVPITSFTTPEESFELVKHTSKTISTTVNPNDTTESTDITWTSSNDAVATVDTNGKVTGVSAGTAIITGKISEKWKVTVTVTVTIIPVESITISKDKLDMKKNETEPLSVSYSPTNATEVTDVIWTSSDDTVARVDSDGKVTALKEGTAIITAKMGTLSDTTNVTVTEVPLTGISLEDNEEKAEAGKSLKLKVKLEPFDATDDITYEYVSSDPEVAEIDADGIVTFKKAGKVKFTVKASNGTNTYEETFEMEVVTPPSPQTGVTPIWVYGGIVAILLIVSIVIFKKKELF